MQDAKCKMPYAECKMQNAKCRMQDARLRLFVCFGGMFFGCYFEKAVQRYKEKRTYARGMVRNWSKTGKK